MIDLTKLKQGDVVICTNEDGMEEYIKEDGLYLVSEVHESYFIIWDMEEDTYNVGNNLDCFNFYARPIKDENNYIVYPEDSNVSEELEEVSKVDDNITILKQGNKYILTDKDGDSLIMRQLALQTLLAHEMPDFEELIDKKIEEKRIAELYKDGDRGSQ